MISPQEWSEFAAVINEFAHEVSQQVVIWNRVNKKLPRYGEGEQSTSSIGLRGLVGYSFSTGIAFNTNSAQAKGTTEKLNCYVLFSKEYLASLGYITSQGNFDFTPGSDTFTIDGVTYRWSGDSPLAPAYDQTLLIMVVLERAINITGKDSRP